MDNLMYRNFLGNVQDPVWIIDLDFKYVYTNEAYKNCHSIERDIIGENLLEIIPKYLAEKYLENLKIMISEKKYMILEEELNGKTLQCRTFPMLDDKGEIEAIGGLIIDITERASREKERIYHRNLLQNVIDAIPEIIFLKDIDGRYQFINKTCKDFHGNLGVNEVIGKMDTEINPDKETSLKFKDIDKKILKNKKAITIESRIKCKNKTIIKESLKSPLLNEYGDAVGIVGISRDITEKKALEEKLRYLSYTDTLTGVYNRASFEDKIQELKSTEKMPIGVIMGDVNGLKLINDTFGHIEGDKLLVSISNVLKKVCGNYGHIFRWGGDEFIILIPNADEKICESVINNIKNACAGKNHGLLELSMSMGLSILKNPDDDIDKILKIAEEKVYKHKLLEQKSILSGAINSLQESLEAKSLETKEHTQRMTKLAAKLGKKMKLSIAQLDELEIATRLHDIGKIGIGEDVLLKPGKLTDQEYQIIKTHTEKGYRIVMASSGLDSVAKTVLTHHERWDGKGYPLGLKRKEIPLSSRIISVVDAYDAMTNNRIYKNAIKKEDAIKEIENSKGTQFDPAIATLFVQMMKQRN